MSSGRRGERRGDRVRRRAATRVRCETGNPRRAPAPPWAASRQPSPPSNSNLRFFFFPPTLPSLLWHFLQIGKWSVSRALPQAAFGLHFQTRGPRVGCAVRRGANPGELGGAPGAAGRAGPLGRPRPSSAWGPRPAPPGARVRWERGKRSASRRVQVHPRGLSPRRWERALPRAAPSLESRVARRPGDPSPRPSPSGWPSAWDRDSAPGSRPRALQVQRGDSARKRSPTSLHAASSGIWNQQEIAGEPSPRLCSQPSVWWREAAPTKVLPPPPPESPAQVCKEGCEICKGFVFQEERWRWRRPMKDGCF